MSSITTAFSVKVRGHHLGVNGEGKAAHYRLTDRWYAGKEPTYDFQNWDGVLFEPAKRVMSEADKERLRLRATNPVRRSRDTPVRRYRT